MTLTFDQSAYCNLLAEVVPVAIETEQQYQRLLKVVENLTFKKNRTLEEKAVHKLLVILIEAYEAQNYPMDKSEPHEILQHIMEASGTNTSDLVGIIGSDSIVSEVLNGKRSISQMQAKALGNYFKVTPNLFQ
ncbi:MAG: transcriptional regulator [Scytonematopsis contorta HA4267-MV1]|jgi:HTH-type transcriptional regulator/antitoxin HigA|nr:transcriptional regulator [Scytonematopsis contorta HA4267-MV1]